MVTASRNPLRATIYKRPLARLLAAAAVALQPASPPPTDRWCERQLHLPPELSAAAGPFDLSMRPYWREPLELLDDPDVRQQCWMADAQAGKTVSLMAALVSRSKCDPAPSMIVAPNQDAMRELRDKIYGMCEVSPAMAGAIPPVSRRNDRWIDLGNMICYMAYTGSPQRMRGRACKYLFCTEVDVWVNDPRLGLSAQLIKARTGAFAEHQVIYESTPSDDASTIAALYARSDGRKFRVPCPQCNHFQELRFFLHQKGEMAGKGGVAGMQDKAGAWLAPEQARGNAYYIGECGCRIESHQKAEMIEAGVWVPRGMTVKAGRLAGTPTRSNRSAGFHISRLYGPHATFGDMAEAYLEHRESNTMRVFWNNWLGLPDRVASKLPNWKELGQRLAWHHRRGTVPAEAYFLEASADVQSDRTYQRVRAWGDKRTSWLVDWECFGRDEKPRQPDELKPGSPIASDLARLETDVLAAHYPVAGGDKNPLGQKQLAVRLLGVDANYRTYEVHEFVRHAQTLYGDRVRAIRGDHKVDPTDLYRMNVVERNAQTGKVYEGGLQLWGISVNVFREQLLALFSYPVDQPGALRLPADILAWGHDYLRQLVNQGPRTEIMPGGRSVVRWVTRDQGLGEHAWDLEVNGLALAHMITGGDWDARNWHRAAAAAAKKPAGDQTPELPRDYDDYSAR